MIICAHAQSCSGIFSCVCTHVPARGKPLVLFHRHCLPGVWEDLLLDLNPPRRINWLEREPPPVSTCLYFLSTCLFFISSGELTQVLNFSRQHFTSWAFPKPCDVYFKFISDTAFYHLLEPTRPFQPVPALSQSWNRYTCMWMPVSEC